jgi:hypothetical protein
MKGGRKATEVYPKKMEAYPEEIKPVAYTRTGGTVFSKRSMPRYYKQGQLAVSVAR